MPSLAYTGTVMTENVFYPLFLVVVLVLVLVLERPTGLRVGILLALVALAFATRVQSAAFVPAILLAPLVLALFEGSLRGVLGRYRILYGALAAVGALALAIRLVTGLSVQELLGAYEPVGEAEYEPVEVLRYLAWHVAELTLYLLVIPVVATIVLLARARTLDRPLQAFLAATVALTACLVPVVAAFASVFSERIEERNMFYVAPLFLIALLAWVERGAPRPRVLSIVAAAACALVVLVIPFDRFLTTSAISDTLMLLPLWSLQDRIGDAWVAPAALALSAGLAAAFVLVPRRYAVVLPLLVLGLWAVSFKPIWWGKHGFERFSRGVLFQGIRAPERDWIDRALPDGATAAFLWTGRTDRMTVNQNEFFSRGVGPVYYTDRSHARRPPGEPGQDRPADRRRHAARRQARHGRVPRRRLHVRARGRAYRPRRRVGRRPLARDVATRRRIADRGPLPGRHVVGRDRRRTCAGAVLRDGSSSSSRATRRSSSSPRPSWRASTARRSGESGSRRANRSRSRSRSGRSPEGTSAASCSP